MKVIFNIIDVIMKLHAGQLHPKPSGDCRMLVHQHFAKHDFLISGCGYLRDSVRVLICFHKLLGSETHAHSWIVEVVNKLQPAHSVFL